MERFPHSPQQIPGGIPPIPPLPPMVPPLQPGFGTLPQRGGPGGGAGGTPWIMIGITAVALLIGAIIIFTQARSVAEGGYAGPGLNTPEARQLATVQVQAARSQIALFSLQHDDRLPDFLRYPGWEQLIQRTDRTGKPSGGTRATGNFKYGPYLHEKPVNPLNVMSNVFVMPTGKSPASRIPGEKTAGFVLHTPSRKLFLTDVTGTKVLTSDPR